jgi:hypothetical protein
MTRSHVRQVATLALLAAVVAGCGGGGDDATADSSDPSQSGAETTPSGTPSETPSETAATIPTSSPDTTADRDSGGPDLCTLFENLDVAALLGEEPGEPFGDGLRCVIEPVADDSTGQVAVGVRNRGQAAFVESRDLLGFESEPYGLGDEAFVSGSGIHVLAGERYIDLQVIRDPLGTTPPPTEDELIAAMRTVLTNLGMD